jgi:hypothetical protein
MDGDEIALDDHAVHFDVERSDRPRSPSRLAIHSPARGLWWT